MALFTGSIYSHALRMQTQLQVILPQDTAQWQNGPLKANIPAKAKPKTLVMLHGLAFDASLWTRYTSIERYTEQYGLAVVLPEVQRSYYVDMKNGLNYYTYISEELPELVSNLFKLSTAPEDYMIAGHSMGGYGALRCAFDHPERYSFVGAFASGCDVHAHIRRSLAEGPDHFLAADARGVFGENVTVEEGSDVFKLAERMAKGEKQPKIYLTCGTDDYLYPDNRRFRAHLDALKIQYTYEEWKGDHTWLFWDQSIQAMLKNIFGE
jgi:S-formylglutathione hydrolase FrmB